MRTETGGRPPGSSDATLISSQKSRAQVAHLRVTSARVLPLNDRRFTLERESPFQMQYTEYILGVSALVGLHSALPLPAHVLSCLFEVYVFGQPHPHALSDEVGHTRVSLRSLHALSLPQWRPAFLYFASHSSTRVPNGLCSTNHFAMAQQTHFFPRVQRDRWPFHAFAHRTVGPTLRKRVPRCAPLSVHAYPGANDVGGSSSPALLASHFHVNTSPLSLCQASRLKISSSGWL